MFRVRLCKKNLRKKTASKVFRQSSKLDICKQEKEKNGKGTPYSQTEKEGFEKIVVKK